MASGKPLEPPLTEGIRKSMRSNKSSGTSPEIRMRKALRDAGYPGYRLNWKKAPGKPDICYPGRRVAIFVNGCFWHRCPHCSPSMPKHNADYWVPKFERNVERDAEKRVQLETAGWTVITIWECEMKDMDSVVKSVVDVLERADAGAESERRGSSDMRHQNLGRVESPIPRMEMRSGQLNPALINLSSIFFN